MLLAKDNSAAAIWIGWIIAILSLLTAGLLKRKIGWILGSALQIAQIGYGYFVTSMYFMGTLFAILWISAIVVGRKGEAIRAQLLRDRGENK
jgi:hypothetical protein